MSELILKGINFEEEAKKIIAVLNPKNSKDYHHARKQAVKDLSAVHEKKLQTLREREGSAIPGDLLSASWVATDAEPHGQLACAATLKDGTVLDPCLIGGRCETFSNSCTVGGTVVALSPSKYLLPLAVRTASLNDAPQGEEMVVSIRGNPNYLVESGAIFCDFGNFTGRDVDEDNFIASWEIFPKPAYGGSAMWEEITYIYADFPDLRAADLAIDD